MIRTIYALLAVLALLCFSCNNKNEAVLDTLSRKVEINQIAEPEEKFQNSDTTIVSGNDADHQKTTQKEPVLRKSIDWDKKIVKNGQLNAEVKDYKKFSLSVNEKIKKYGGYISSEEQSQSDYKIENTIVIKVPVAEFENAVNDLLQDVEKITVKRISSDDVTTALIDGKSRLEAKRQVRLRYLDLLNQAKNMEEIIKVQSEINSIQEDIELVSGRINALSNTSAMSTIHFNYLQILDAQALNDEPKPDTFMTKLKASFSNGWYWIGEIVISLIALWPVLLIVVFGVYYLKRKPVMKIK